MTYILESGREDELEGKEMTDYTDLVERLRRDGIAARDTLKCVEMAPTVDPEDALKAADAIEAQAKRIEELEAALKPFALGETAIEAGHNAASDDYPLMQVVSCGNLRQARKVLGEKE